MIQQQNGFSGMMPDISGKWTNRLTGQTAMVRDCVFGDDGMYVRLASGNPIPFETFSRDWFQMSDEEYDASGEKIVSVSPGKQNKPTIQAPEPPRPAPVQQAPASIIDVDAYADSAYADNAALPVSAGPVDNLVTTNQHEDMIAKVLSKCTDEPGISVKINWGGFPVPELTMLREYFDVTEDDIAAYIRKTYINSDEIEDAVKDFVAIKFGADPDAPVQKGKTKKS